MSLNRLTLLAAAAGAALSLGACATTGPAPNGTGPLTSTERFSINVERRPQEVRLAIHAEGLSTNQANALGTFVRDWMRADGPTVLIQTPAGDRGGAYRMTEDARRFLVSQGVAPNQIRVTAYEPGEGPATLIVGFMTYVARGPDCAASWGNISDTSNNNVPNPNYGCAVTANVAAMVNPADLVDARPEDPVDPGRRSVVIGRYRAGESTSTARDSQASGAVSNAVN